MTATKTTKALPTLIVGTDALTKSIESIIRRGNKLQDEVQVLGLSLLAHINEHSNVTLLNKLVLEFPKGLRRNALVEWALANGKVKLNEGEDKKTLPLLFDKTKATNLDKANDKPWFDFKPEKPVDECFDFAKMLAVLVGKASKSTNLADGQAELLAAAKALLPA